MSIIEHSGDRAGANASNGQIILPNQAMPALIHIIPQEHRPFFPGQAIPLTMSADIWLPTLEAIQARDQDVVGLIATKHDVKETPKSTDLYEVGCLCKVHRVHREGDQLQVLLEGLQRFKIGKWLNTSPPLTASVRYFPQDQGNQSNDETAYAVAIINTSKNLSL